MDLPDHAKTEIAEARGARKVELQRWWAAWAAAGDARSAAREASVAAADAERAYRDCRMILAARTQGSLPPGACACGDHAAALTAALEAHLAARKQVASAVAHQKAGG